MKHNKDIYKNSVVLYMRYSSDNQNDNSIAYQKQTLYTYCTRKGYKVVEEYIDEAKSATTDNRPNFKKLIQDAQNNPKWSKVIVYDLSRYSRNMNDSVNYKTILENLGINLISATQDFGPGAEGALLENILFSLNDYSSKNNAKHTFDGIAVKARLGMHCGGVPPLGYDIDSNRRLTINEEVDCMAKAELKVYKLRGVLCVVKHLLQGFFHCSWSAIENIAAIIIVDISVTSVIHIENCKVFLDESKNH